jgi:hypothetical protein
MLCQSMPVPRPVRLRMDEVEVEDVEAKAFSFEEAN